MPDIQSAIEDARAAREVHRFTIPPELRKDLSPTKIGLRLLTAEQELMASKQGKFDVNRINYAAAKLSIIEFDGKYVDNGDSAIDLFWERADPKVRSLILQACTKMSSPTKEQEDSFFASEVLVA